MRLLIVLFYCAMAVLLSPAVALASTNDDAPVISSLDQATPQQSQPLALSAKEIGALSQASSESLLDARGAGCRRVWSNENQRYETQCANPTGYLLVGGVMGGLVGSFFGIGGVVAGAGVGAVLMYGMYKLTGYED